MDNDINEKIQNLLADEIVRQFEAIREMPEGTEKDKAIENLNKLYKLKMEDERIDWEAEKFYQEQQAANNDRVYKRSEDALAKARKESEDAYKRVHDENLEREAAANEKKKARREVAFKVIETTVRIAEIGVAIGGMIMYRRIFNDGLAFEQTGALQTPEVKNHLGKAFTLFSRKMM